MSNALSSKPETLLNKSSGRNQLYLFLIGFKQVETQQCVPNSPSRQSCFENGSWKSSRNCWCDPDEAKRSRMRAISKIPHMALSEGENLIAHQSSIFDLAAPETEWCVWVFYTRFACIHQSHIGSILADIRDQGKPFVHIHGPVWCRTW